MKGQEVGESKKKCECGIEKEVEKRMKSRMNKKMEEDGKTDKGGQTEAEKEEEIGQKEKEKEDVEVGQSVDVEGAGEVFFFVEQQYQEDREDGGWEEERKGSKIEHGRTGDDRKKCKGGRIEEVKRRTSQPRGAPCLMCVVGVGEKC